MRKRSTRPASKQTLFKKNFEASKFDLTKGKTVPCSGLTSLFIGYVPLPTRYRRTNSSVSLKRLHVKQASGFLGPKFKPLKLPPQNFATKASPVGVNTLGRRFFCLYITVFSFSAE